MNVSAKDVKSLREKTGVGLMDCKKALEESQGDIEKAVVWLREKGMARAQKKSGRTTAEGLVLFRISPDKKHGVVMEINCETDFVSRNNDFQDFSGKVVDLALQKKISDVEELKQAATWESGKTVEDLTNEMIAKIGENVQIRRLTAVSASSGVVGGYSHMGGKIGCLVALSSDSASDDLLKDVAMHVAASVPKYLTSSEVQAAELDTEKDIIRKKLEEEGKPKEIMEKILQGQVQKYYKEVCLVDQPFVKEPKKSVSQVVKEAGGGEVAQFVRFQLGEGVEKKEENLAEEVAKLQK